MPVSEAQLTHIGATLTSLRSLSIRGLTDALSCSSLDCLSALTALTSLSVDKIALASAGAFDVGAANSLRSLELSGALLSRAAFASLNLLSRLESLYLWGTGERLCLCEGEWGGGGAQHSTARLPAFIACHCIA